ncbi:hypothetical protein A9Q99_20940 [Gammaproteobacteria bacterium 45_16_T64]|nr:hypothetical protein A9Q99_20940 [Gammaproteobacteria bacterium 45_16_T64]
MSIHLDIRHSSILLVLTLSSAPTLAALPNYSAELINLPEGGYATAFTERGTIAYQTSDSSLGETLPVSVVVNPKESNTGFTLDYNGFSVYVSDIAESYAWGHAIDATQPQPIIHTVRCTVDLPSSYDCASISQNNFDFLSIVAPMLTININDNGYATANVFLGGEENSVVGPYPGLLLPDGTILHDTENTGSLIQQLNNKENPLALSAGFSPDPFSTTLYTVESGQLVSHPINDLVILENNVDIQNATMRILAINDNDTLALWDGTTDNSGVSPIYLCDYVRNSNDCIVRSALHLPMNLDPEDTTKSTHYFLSNTDILMYGIFQTKDSYHLVDLVDSGSIALKNLPQPEPEAFGRAVLTTIFWQESNLSALQSIYVEAIDCNDDCPNFPETKSEMIELLITDIIVQYTSKSNSTSSIYDVFDLEKFTPTIRDINGNGEILVVYQWSESPIDVGVNVIYTPETVNQQPIFHYSFDSGLNQETVGNVNATVQGNPSITSDGASNSAMQINTAADKIVISDPFGDIHTTGELSLSFWLKANNFDNGSVEVVGTSSRGDGELSLMVGGNGEIAVYIDGKKLWTGNDPSKSIVAGEWTHLAITYNQVHNQILIYRNGQEILSSSFPEGKLVSFDSGMDFNIGRGRFNSSSVFFPGQLDEIKAYSRTLTPQEIDEQASTAL